MTTRTAKTKKPRPARQRPGGGTENLGTQVEKKIKERAASVGIIGVGYVGLPLGVELGRVGFKVTGIDIDDRKVKTISSGRSDVEDIKDFEVKELVDLKRLHC